MKKINRFLAFVLSAIIIFSFSSCKNISPDKTVHNNAEKISGDKLSDNSMAVNISKKCLKDGYQLCKAVFVSNDKILILQYNSIENFTVLTLYNIYSGKIESEFIEKPKSEIITNCNMFVIGNKSVYIKLEEAGKLYYFEDLNNLKEPLVSDISKISNETNNFAGFTVTGKDSIYYLSKGSLMKSDFSFSKVEKVCNLHFENDVFGYIDGTGKDNQYVIINSCSMEGGHQAEYFYDIKSNQLYRNSTIDYASYFTDKGLFIDDVENQLCKYFSYSDKVGFKTFLFNSDMESITNAVNSGFFTSECKKDDSFVIRYYSLEKDIVSYCFKQSTEGLLCGDAYSDSLVLLCFSSFISDEKGYSNSIIIDSFENNGENQKGGLLLNSRNDISSACYSIADRIEKNYSVKVKLGNDIDKDYDSYKAKVNTVNSEILSTLEVIEEVLKEFPKGFFNEMKFDNITSVEFQLGGNISNEYGDTISTAEAVTTELDNRMIIIADASAMETKMNFAHEIMHMIDRKIISDAENGTDNEAINKFYDWVSLFPKDNLFEYSYASYESADGSTDKYTLISDGKEKKYFIDSYSRAYPTEDKSRVFEHFFCNDTKTDKDIFENEYIQSRAKVIADAIRASFKSAGSYNGKFCWEKNIQNI